MLFGRLNLYMIYNAFLNKSPFKYYLSILWREVGESSLSPTSLRFPDLGIAQPQLVTMTIVDIDQHPWINAHASLQKKVSFTVSNNPVLMTTYLDHLNNNPKQLRPYLIHCAPLRDNRAKIL